MPELYAKIASKKQLGEKTLEKLYEEFGVFSAKPFSYKQTAKTIYLDREGAFKLAEHIFNKIEMEDFTVREKIENEINVFGFVSSPERYAKNGFYGGQIVGVSNGNELYGSILIQGANGNKLWVKIPAIELKKIKRKDMIIVFKSEKKIGAGKMEVYISDFISYR